MVRTRYAPSPTGSLHIGNVRSGLFAYLFARHHHGTFILRIDDTDPERSSKESLEEILASLRWLGLDWDEGPPDPRYFQSNRIDRYREVLRQLLREGKAYPCYCTPEELEAKRKQAEREKRKPVYDGKCRNLPFDPELPLPERGGERRYAIRFRTPQQGETVVDDLVKGRAVFQNSELDDLIIFRSDGIPTYNFASVVDDIDFRITHVVRGDDHMPNTPRQIKIFEALGAKPPLFAHLPLVLGHDGKPLSKRHGATSVFAYRDAGYFPEALLNYLARLGWSYGDQEIFSKQELIEKFDFSHCGKSPGIFNPEKLLWLNFHYLKERPVAKLARELRPFIERRGYRVPDDEVWLEMVVVTLRERAKTLVEMVDFAHFYLSEDIELDPKAASKFLTPQILEPIETLARELETLEPEFETTPAVVASADAGARDQSSEWENTRAAALLKARADRVREVFERVLARFNLKLGQLAQPVRVALTGGTVSPGIFEVIAVLGIKRSVARLLNASTWIRQQLQETSERAK